MMASDGQKDKDEWVVSRWVLVVGCVLLALDSAVPTATPDDYVLWRTVLGGFSFVFWSVTAILVARKGVK